MMKLLLVAASVIAADAAKTSVKILFAGNSLTYVNDLPTMLKNLCANAGSDITVTTQSSVVGGSAFVEHSVTPEHYNDPGLDGIVKSVEKVRSPAALVLPPMTMPMTFCMILWSLPPGV